MNRDRFPSHSGPLVYLVDDDASVLDALSWLLRRENYEVVTFGCGADAVRVCQQREPSCLLLDLWMPDMTGMEVARELRTQSCWFPYIFLSAHGSVGMAKTAMRLGAIDFIEKPVTHDHLLQRVAEAVRRDERARQEQEHLEQVRSRLARLSPREREVMDLVVAGLLTKEIASQLGISPKTVEVHRSHITKKMQVECVAELVRLMSDYARREQALLESPWGRFALN